MIKTVLFMTLMAAVPASETYTMPSYDFGNGGGAGASSTYEVQSSIGAPGGELSSSTYRLPVGIRASTSAAVPAAPTLANPNDSYDSLRLTLNTADQPSDAKYAIAISDDDFVTTEYVQPDQTIGPTFTITNYQSYAAWGDASGSEILGLAYNTTYKVKVAALHGDATGSAFGPTASATTTTPSVSFALATSLTSTPPFIANFTSLNPGSVVTANATINVTLTTNAKYGGSLLVQSTNAGITSPSKSSTISSATADLTAATTGYGAQVTATGQSSGGPLNATSPYNGTSNNVGGLVNSLQAFASFSAPITSGTATLALLAKATNATPAATDYSDIVTVVLAPVF